MTELEGRRRPIGIGSSNNKDDPKERKEISKENDANDYNNNQDANDESIVATEAFYELDENATEMDELRVLWQSAEHSSNLNNDSQVHIRKLYFAVANECDRLLLSLSENDLKIMKSEIYEIYGKSLLYLAMNDFNPSSLSHSFTQYLEAAIDALEKVNDKDENNKFPFQLFCARFMNDYIQNENVNNHQEMNHGDGSLKQLLLHCNYKDEFNVIECLKSINFVTFNLDHYKATSCKRIVIETFSPHLTEFSFEILLIFAEFCQDYIEELMELAVDDSDEYDSLSIDFDHIRGLLIELEKIFEKLEFTKEDFIHENENEKHDEKITNNKKNENDHINDKFLKVESIKIQNMLLFGSFYSLLERKYYQKAYDISMNLNQKLCIPIPEYIKELVEDDTSTTVATIAFSEKNNKTIKKKKRKTNP